MTSLYKRLGGEEAIDNIVDAHYHKVMTDSNLSVHFDHIDMGIQKRKFRAYMHTITGGPLSRAPLELRTAHSHANQNGLTDGHFDAFVRHFKDALHESNIEPALIDELMVGVEGARRDVMGR